MGKLAARIWEDLEFDIVKETWNTYYLEDGVRIRGRTILKKLMRRKQGSRYEFTADFQNIFITIAPIHLRGKPGSPLTREEMMNAAKIGRPARIVDSREDWNIYLVPDMNMTLKVKLTVVEIYRIPGRYDKHGEPIYAIRSTNVIVPMKKEKHDNFSSPYRS